MDLEPNGMDIFYIDESEHHAVSAITSIRVPLLRPKQNGGWEFVWSNYYEQAVKWRRALSANHNIRFREELHGYKILKHQGQYHKTRRNLSPAEAVALYRDALATLTWLPERAIMTTYATAQSELMGYKGVAACLFGMFQRMRSHCRVLKVNGMAFFDEGHPSYVHLYRMAQKYLPTGSAFGGWGAGKMTQNMPLAMFPKDGNIKQSDLSYFVQVADLVCYAVRIKIDHERGVLAAKRQARNHHTVYDSIAQQQLNTRVTTKRNDAICPI